MTSDSQPIACTLTGKDLQDRITWIGQLATGALLSHERADLTLHLRYAPEAVERVRMMVHAEQECCAFLTFDLQEYPDELVVTIKVPEKARNVAGMLFEHFTAGNTVSGASTRKL
jgi:hypothetical protein